MRTNFYGIQLMHASIALCVMMFGGLVYPDSEIKTLSLNPLNDFSGSTSIQDLEWKERVKRMPLPRVPTIDDRQQAGDDNRTRQLSSHRPEGHATQAERDAGGADVARRYRRANRVRAGGIWRAGKPTRAAFRQRSLCKCAIAA